MKHSPLAELSRELSVLSQAISYPNLSAASQHVGVSQSQLSRMVAKIEKTWGITLLEREVKRRSAWTPIAHELVQAFLRGSRHIESELQRLIHDSPLQRLRMGTLEGLVPTASEIGNRLISTLRLETLELDVYDLHELEERFLRADLDLILTMREPGRRKYSYSKVLGYQSLHEIHVAKAARATRIQSGFEFQSQSRSHQRRKNSSESAQTILISNSLSVRKHWLETYGGTGLFPSSVHQKSSGERSEIPVLLLGSESLGTQIWKRILG